jgi:hypothetical protein
VRWEPATVLCSRLIDKSGGFPFADSHFGAFFLTSSMCRVLIFLNPKCGGSCSMRIQHVLQLFYLLIYHQGEFKSLKLKYKNQFSIHSSKELYQHLLTWDKK